MSFVRTLEEAQLAFDINYFTALELIAAVEELLASNPELRSAEELTELVRLNRKQQTAIDRAPALLGVYLAANPVPAERRPRSLEECGKALLKARLEQYQDGNDPPMTVCRMVWAIEHKFDYPEWLGGLFNACDWCTDKSAREHFAGVRQEAERLVKLL